MAISRLITVEAIIHGYQYKSAWLNPVIEEELSCKREIGKAHDTHALAMLNIIDEDIKTFGRVPHKISASTRYARFDFQ